MEISFFTIIFITQYTSIIHCNKRLYKTINLTRKLYAKGGCKMKRETFPNEPIRQFEVKVKEGYVTKTFRLPESLISEMSKIAQNKGISLNELVHQCCDYAIQNLKED